MIKRLLSGIVLAMSVIGAAYAQPAFKGGQQALDEFIKSKIVYPEYSRQNCISGTIDVAFRLDENGGVTDAKIQQGPGIDLDDEALRVIKLTSGMWQVPAGHITTTYLVQPIRFDPNPALCRNTTAKDMQAAVTDYRNRQELENAVTNYYINKYQGKADLAKEPIIIALKKQLGFDDELINDMLNQAGEKLKQKDLDGACTDWNFIRNIGSDKADSFIQQYCSKKP
ncbi:energy transducer TonB [Mucilaginibacter dorajii]|uniref:TonB C-terminal domain-containing protein n=1 Tax=Mucilaginibacter dorajii TaxID=692994 RepID=A0ABP7R321_9SPHI|nr:energy transducer TonB [Mucilaginibacter dorajii]MCS3738040.1 TonB family protein [Mucilaginibacter dorajii]